MESSVVWCTPARLVWLFAAFILRIWTDVVAVLVQLDLVSMSDHLVCMSHAENWYAAHRASQYLANVSSVPAYCVHSYAMHTQAYMIQAQM